MSLSFNMGENSITVFLNGQITVVEKSHLNFEKIKGELKKKAEDRNLELLKNWMSLKDAVSRWARGNIEIDENSHEVLYKGVPVHNYMTTRLISMFTSEFDVTPWVNFMENVMENPNPVARDELIEWLEKGQMPLTPDGKFLAFKKVRSNFMDCHSGQFDNSPGQYLEMSRDSCDPSRSNTCSTGFHFCSIGYLSHFGGEKVVIVEINPRDVTAIPSDYNITKGRCCAYTVLEELSSEEAARHKVWQRPVLDYTNPQELPDEVLNILNDPITSKRSAKKVNPEVMEEEKPVEKKESPKKTTSKAKKPAKKVTSEEVAPAPKVKKTSTKKPAITKQQEPSFTARGMTYTLTDLKKYVDKEGSVSKAAASIGVGRTTLSTWLKKG